MNPNRNREPLGWDREELVAQLLNDVERGVIVSGVLEVPGMTIYPHTQLLDIPELREGNVRYDLATNEVLINFEVPACDGASASSIVDIRDHRIGANAFRSFIHDYTFSILAEETNCKLSSHFPQIFDGKDKMTPDLIASNSEATVVIEFATTKCPTESSVRTKFAFKKFIYEDALRRRISKQNDGVCNLKKYAFSPMICNGDILCVGNIFTIPNDLVNELCARFRFARMIEDAAVSTGLILEDDDYAQTTRVLSQMFMNIKPEYQKEDAEANTPREMRKILIPLSKERVDTSDVSFEDAYLHSAKVYMRLLDDHIDETTREPNNLDKSELLKQYKSSLIGSRLDKKAILQLPGAVCRSNTGWEWAIENSQDERCVFINSIIREASSNEWKFEKSKDELMRLANLDSDDDQLVDLEKTKRMYKRIKVRIEESYRIEMAKVGVQGKELSRDPEVHLYREEKRSGFSIDVNTDDIDSFLNLPVEKPCLQLLASTCATMEILRRAYIIQDEEFPHTIPTIRNLLMTPTGRWMSLLSAIGIELSISLRQNVDRDQFVVKKLRYFDAYLIIKPTKSDSHIFYMMVFKPENHQVSTQFFTKRIYDYTQWSCTEWVSMSLSKLVNLTKSESFFITQMSQWSRYYGLTLENGMKKLEVWRMCRLLLMVHLEDKARTEEVMTLFRYISMEKFSLVKNDNGKMMEKLPNVLRSRAQVWACKKLISCMCSPNYEPSVKGDEDDNSKMDRHWLNMENPYTGESISNPAQLVELYYVGYATNKDAKTWENTEFDLIKKIIKYEDELLKADPKYCGLEERENVKEYRFHEWSRKMNCATADFMKGVFRKQYGDKCEETINDKIIRRLQRITWDEVASLKASSCFDPSFRPEPNERGKISTHRMKMLIRTLQIKGELRDTPALTFPSSLEWVNNDGGVRVDLFRKNQHGGLREIYVMEIHSRIIQLVIEEIARALCHEMDSEIMTHPKNKLRKPQEHMYKAALKGTAFRLNVSSSNDAKVWNQGHHVCKFAQFLIRLLPKMWHGAIINTLKQWTKKRMALPDGVLNLLSRKDQVKLWDPVHRKVSNAYAGIGSTRWMPTPRTHYITIESGMMQGILHYISSAFHSSFLNFRNHLWKKIAKRVGIDSQSIDLVSSDDSSRMTDVFGIDKELFRAHVKIVKADHLCIKALSPMMGIWLSPKSTMCCNGVMEFNSEFFFRACVYRPTLKWSLASLGIMEVESLVERQEIMYNQITELLEGGSGFRQASETQVAQALLHYKLMGSEVNVLYGEYIGKLLDLPDPSLGFFFLDKPIGTGLSGFNYNLWRAINHSSRLSCLYAGFIRQGRLTTTTSGQLTRGAQVRFGNREKTRRLIESATESCPGWKEKLEEDPIILYEPARDLPSAVMKMMVKLTSPSVVKSISGGNSLSRIMAASVYTINGLAVTLGSNWMDSLKPIIKNVSPSKKVSLWRLITMDIINTEPLTNDEEKVLFPHSEHYCGLNRIMRDLSTMVLAEMGSRRMLRSNIQIYPETSFMPFSLEDIVRWRWFAHELPASMEVLQEIWDNYKRVYPWLCDDAKATLNHVDCHFESQIQLRNYVARQSVHSRSVHLTGAPIRDTTSRDLLVVAIIKNQIPGYTLVSPDDVRPNSVDDSDDLVSRIASYMSFPLADVVRKQKIEDALANSNSIWIPQISRPSAKKVRLGVIQAFIKMRSSLEDERMKTQKFTSYLKMSRLGVYGGFTIRQTPHDESWIGKGEWRGKVGDASVCILIQDNKLKSITTNNQNDLISSESLLNGLMREMKINEYVESAFSQFSYNLKVISKGSGAPIFINRDFNMERVFSFSRMFLSITDDSLRLMATEHMNKHFTVVSYKIYPSDFRFNKPIEESHGGLNFWVNNLSFPPKWAQRFLSTIKSKGPDCKSIDLDTFSSFVSDSLPPALRRAGMDLSIMKTQSVSSCPHGPTESESVDIMDMFGFDEPFEYNNLMIRACESDDSPLELEFTIEFGDFDIMEGNLPIELNKATVGNIRRIHNIWNKYAIDAVSTLSTQDIRKIEKGIYCDRAKELIGNLEYYCGMTFIQEAEKDTSQDVEEQNLEEPDVMWR